MDDSSEVGQKRRLYSDWTQVLREVERAFAEHVAWLDDVPMRALMSCNGGGEICKGPKKAVTGMRARMLLVDWSNGEEENALVERGFERPRRLDSRMGTRKLLRLTSLNKDRNKWCRVWIVFSVFGVCVWWFLNVCQSCRPLSFVASSVPCSSSLVHFRSLFVTHLGWTSG